MTIAVEKFSFGGPAGLMREVQLPTCHHGLINKLNKKGRHQRENTLKPKLNQTKQQGQKAAACL